MGTSGIAGSLKGRIAEMAMRDHGEPAVSFADLLASIRVAGRLVRLRRPSKKEIEALDLGGDLRRTAADRERAAAAIAVLTGLSADEIAALPQSIGLTLLSALETHIQSGGIHA